MLRINAKVARSYAGRGFSYMPHELPYTDRGRSYMARRRSYTVRRLTVGGLVGLLLGCPLYDDECDRQDDCASGFRCDRFSQRCEPAVVDIGCRRPDQCLTGETCTPDFSCRPGSCDFHGCVTGYRCGVVDSAYACVPETSGDAGEEDASTPDGTGGMGGTGGSAGESGAAAAAGAGPTDAGQDAGGVSDASTDASL